MNHEIYSEILSESIPDCKKVVLLMLLFQIDKDLFHEFGFSERDNK